MQNTTLDLHRNSEGVLCLVGSRGELIPYCPEPEALPTPEPVHQFIEDEPDPEEAAISLGHENAFEPEPVAIAKINVNTASAKELVEIKGIGPKTAKKIVSERSLNPFVSPEDFVTRFRVDDPSVVLSEIEV